MLKRDIVVLKLYAIYTKSVRTEEYVIIQKGMLCMGYLTTAEYAKIWNISQRRVAIYCKDGRIKGAVLKGKVWLIPINTCKPQDPRSKKYNKKLSVFLFQAGQ